MPLVAALKRRSSPVHSIPMPRSRLFSRARGPSGSPAHAPPSRSVRRSCPSRSAPTHGRVFFEYMCSAVSLCARPFFYVLGRFLCVPGRFSTACSPRAAPRGCGSALMSTAVRVCAVCACCAGREVSDGVPGGSGGRWQRCGAGGETLPFLGLPLTSLPFLDLPPLDFTAFPWPSAA